MTNRSKNKRRWMSNVLAEQESFSCFFYDQKVMSLTKWSLARNQNKVSLYDCDDSKYLYGYNYQCLLFFTILAFAPTSNDGSGSSPSHPYLVAVPACKLNSTQNIHGYKFWLSSSMSHVKFISWNVNKADSRVCDLGMIIDRPLGINKAGRWVSL